MEWTYIPFATGIKLLGIVISTRESIATTAETTGETEENPARLRTCIQK